MSKRLIIVFLVISFANIDLFSALPENENEEKDTCTNQILISPETKGVDGLNWRRRKFANTIYYAEVMGVGEFYSLNFEYILESNMKHMFTGRIGVGAFKGSKGFETNVPLLINFLFGKDNMFEIGVGGVYSVYSDGSEVYPVGNIGFRHQPAKGGFMYKICFTPYFPREEIAGSEDYVIKLWGGVGVGWAF